MENHFALSFSKNRINEMSSLGLAHIGDAVYELLCRSYLCCTGDHTVKNLHKDTISLVNAQAQSERFSARGDIIAHDDYRVLANEYNQLLKKFPANLLWQLVGLERAPV